jgi:hypothetical protein
MNATSIGISEGKEGKIKAEKSSTHHPDDAHTPPAQSPQKATFKVCSHDEMSTSLQHRREER